MKTVVEDLEELLQEFIRKHKITHDEYRAATDLIVSEVKAGEESLLFDVFLEAEATDVVNRSADGSVEAIEGPFYLPDAPVLNGPPYVMPHRPDEKGEPLIFTGRVESITGEPIAGAMMDLWHADADGLYSNIHPGIPDWNLRGRFFTDADGRFEVRTIVPPPYEIPKDGPTGVVLSALGRHFFRPAHLHVKVHHPGYAEHTSQLYFEGDQYLETDVANAVRDGLIVKLVPSEDDAVATRYGLEGAFSTVSIDFVLRPRAS